MQLCLIALLVAFLAPTDVQGWKELGEGEATHTDESRHLGDSNYVQLVSDDSYPETGCLIVKNSIPNKDQKLLLGSCHLPNQAWRYDNGLFRTQLDDGMCMQAGRGATPQHGTQMRLFSCDENSVLQQFDYDQVTIRLATTNLCVVFRGVNSNVNVDPVILKSCEKSDGQDNWSVDIGV